MSLLCVTDMRSCAKLLRDSQIPPVPFFTAEEENYIIAQYTIQGFRNSELFLHYWYNSDQHYMQPYNSIPIVYGITSALQRKMSEWLRRTSTCRGSLEIIKAIIRYGSQCYPCSLLMRVTGLVLIWCHWLFYRIRWLTGPSQAVFCIQKTFYRIWKQWSVLVNIHTSNFWRSLDRDIIDFKWSPLGPPRKPRTSQRHSQRMVEWTSSRR